MAHPGSPLASPMSQPMMATSSEGGRRHLKRLSLAGQQLGASKTPSLTPRHTRMSLLSSPNLQHTPSDLNTNEQSEKRLLQSAGPNLENVSTPQTRPPAPVRARSTGHARRQSSIAYRTSPNPLSPAAHFSPVASPLAAKSRYNHVHPEVDMIQTPTITEEPAFEQQKTSPKPGDVMLSGATLVQQHGELLSYIAQKERKCLDLREELKKQEAELSLLKAKWEAIVARDVATTRAQQPLKPPKASTTGIKAPRGSPNLLASPGGTAYIGLGVTEDERTPTGSPELSLLPPPDLGTSARRWVGGLVKSATASVDRMLENLAAPVEYLPPPSPRTPLRALPEEAEERPLARGDSPGSSIASRRRESSSSLTTDESAFFEGSQTRSSSMSSMSDLDQSTSSADTVKASSSEPNHSNKTPTMETAQESWPGQIPSEDLRFQDEQRQARHARKRSTFEALGQAATSFGSGLGKRWGDVTSSETFRNSKRATLQFVDQFEKTLADAINIDTDPSAARSTPASPRSASAPTTPQSAARSVMSPGARQTALLGSLTEEDEEDDVTQQLSPRSGTSTRFHNERRTRHAKKPSGGPIGNLM